MKVDRYDGLLRYLVHSDTGPDTYLVDLAEHKGAGKCDCTHFRCRIEPHHKVGNRFANPEQARCKHIRAARELLGRELVDALIRNENQKPAKR